MLFCEHFLDLLPIDFFMFQPIMCTFFVIDHGVQYIFLYLVPILPPKSVFKIVNHPCHDGVSHTISNLLMVFLLLDSTHFLQGSCSDSLDMVSTYKSGRVCLMNLEHPS